MKERFTDRQVERYSLNLFIVVGSLLMALGVVCALPLGVKSAWFYVIVGVCWAAGLYLMILPLSQARLPKILIHYENGIVRVVASSKKTAEIPAAQILDIDVRRRYFLAIHATRLSRRSGIDCGYVIFKTKSLGDLRVGLVHRPYEVRADLLAWRDEALAETSYTDE